MKNIVLTFFVLFMVVGCQSLPDGTPPKGDIVAPFTPSTTLPSKSKALNHMITEFTMAVTMLPNSGRPVISLLPTDDALGNELGNHLIDELKREGIIGTGGETHYRLKSTSHTLGVLKKGEKTIRWKIKLISKDDTVICKKEIVFKANP